jgi:phosphate-selective porin OprO/OprP
MKVPFSTEWLTLDNQVNFIERATSRPLYPFFDRGVMLWGDVAGGRLTYGLGAYTGVGVDIDASKGDIDDHKDVVGRVFLQPFRSSTDSPLNGLYLAGGATYGRASVPTTRFETGGLASANFESRVWRWRTEQTLGTNGRATDVVSAEVGSRTRWGLEAHYLEGSLLASFEYLSTRYDDITLFHDYWVGSSRLRHEPVLGGDGEIEVISGWVSWFVTGERKQVDFHGWRQPDAADPRTADRKGHGGWEILARFSRTATERSLFESTRVTGFAPADTPTGSAAVGEGMSVTASIVQGAPRLYEATVGTNWTVNRNLRTQLNLTWLWAPDYEDGRFGIVSGAGSDLYDATRKNRLVRRELSLSLRLIFRL